MDINSGDIVIYKARSGVELPALVQNHTVKRVRIIVRNGEHFAARYVKCDRLTLAGGGMLNDADPNR
mgnify:CR=1 FL=1